MATPGERAAETRLRTALAERLAAGKAHRNSLTEAFARGASIAQVAREAGVSELVVREWVTGQRTPYTPPE